MFALERQKMIMELLNQNGSVSVGKLSEEMNVTEETVRRDLEKLEKQELLRRTHGGALPIDDSSVDLSLKRRKAINVEAKELIAKTAAENVAAGDTIFLDASTTTFYMARELKRMKIGVTVITNSLRAIDELADCDAVKLIAIGGLIGKNRSFVGSFAVSSIEKNYFANKMFFSSKGVIPGSGILDSNEDECAIKQQMLKNSNEHFFLCDKSKIGRVGFVRVCELDDVDTFVTESDIDNEWRAELEALGVGITIAK